jgi:hypothetical protein
MLHKAVWVAPLVPPLCAYAAYSLLRRRKRFLLAIPFLAFSGMPLWVALLVVIAVLRPTERLAPFMTALVSAVFTGVWLGTRAVPVTGGQRSMKLGSHPAASFRYGLTWVMGVGLAIGLFFPLLLPRVFRDNSMTAVFLLLLIWIVLTASTYSYERAKQRGPRG